MGPLRNLTPLEARVLGVLVEKQHTVPDTYPLSLNALVAGCNQKTARSPVIEATEAEVLTAVDSLKTLSLVFEGSGSRVVRFEHNLGRRLGVPGQSVALLAVLMLRGPQTAAELRLNTERLHIERGCGAELAQPAGGIAAGGQGRGLAQGRGQPRLQRQLGRLPGPQQRTGEQLVAGQIEGQQTLQHRRGAAPAGGGQGPGPIGELGVQPRLIDRIGGDAVPQQQQLNHRTAGEP